MKHGVDEQAKYTKEVIHALKAAPEGSAEQAAILNHLNEMSLGIAHFDYMRSAFRNDQTKPTVTQFLYEKTK